MYLLVPATTLLSTLCVLQIVSAAPATSSSASISTCPARTINYITHKLPQQCLTSSRGTTVTATTPSTTSSTEASSQTQHYTPRDHEAARPIDASGSGSPNLGNAEAGAPMVTDAGDATTLTAGPGSPITIVSATAISSSTQIALVPAIIEDDSALESGSFLSFEDWKKQNLIKAGQSEHMGRDANKEQTMGRKRPSAVHGSLDSLGDDAEIDLDFGGLVSPGLQADGLSREHSLPSTASDQTVDADAKPETSRRSKDAGKTSKERFNYASFDCAAIVLKSNPQAKHPTSVLIENKDAYMLNECSAENKFLILELCQDLSIDTIVLANFEYFSSIFRQFHVSVSDLYPVKADKWRPLGTFEARNTREVQAFLIKNPVIWARYVKIEFLTHYGSEYYCPVSLVRVHGTTMLEEYKHDQGGSANDDDDEDETQQSSTELPVETNPKDAASTGEFEEMLASKFDGKYDEAIVDGNGDKEDLMTASQASEISEITMRSRLVREAASSMPSSPVLHNLFVQLASQNHMVCTVDEIVNESAKSPSQSTRAELGASSTATSNTPSSTRVSGTTDTASSRVVEASLSTPTSSQSVAQSSSNTASSKSAREPPASSPASAPKSTTQASSRVKLSSSSSADRKPSWSGTQSAPASPTMQESFFRSVQKRLQMLESNSSLSLQYIEEQSKSLQEAFRKVEQRQLSKTTVFLNHLNHTVLNELREFRQQYDQLWQSTVIELEIQREQYQLENRAMHARLGVLADELIFQKRISILQMTLILVCIGLVLFSRGPLHNYLELPLVQSVLSRSPSRRWKTSSTGSPLSDRPVIATNSAQRASASIMKSHRRILSDDSIVTGDDLNDAGSLPTPVSFDEFPDAERFRDDVRTDTDIEFDPSTIERPSTSPPILLSDDEGSSPQSTADSDMDTIETRLLGSPSYPIQLDEDLPQLTVQESSPAKHLTWALPDPPRLR